LDESRMEVREDLPELHGYASIIVIGN
jgi:hypothetical protein